MRIMYEFVWRRITFESSLHPLPQHNNGKSQHNNNNEGLNIIIKLMFF